MADPAWLYDGETALRHEVEVSRSGGDLLILLAGGDRVTIAGDRLTHVESRRDCAIYGLRDTPGWRLGVPTGSSPDLAAILPAKAQYGRWIDRIGLVPAIAVGVVVSAAILFLGNRFPEWAAPYVPAAWEERYGDSLVGDFGGRFCNGPGGQAALDKLARELSPAAAPLNIRVVRVPVVNAAALPGGNIVIFEELLKESDSADELAGVLAHEIAHIEERHVTQAMIRHLGLGMIVSAFGGNTGANIETLMSARYSRGAESQADDDAIRSLSRANISPLPTAAFFERLAKQEEKLGRAVTPLSYLSSHPISSERRRKFRASFVKGHAYQPALSRDEWEAIFNICFNDPRREQKRISFFP